LRGSGVEGGRRFLTGTGQFDSKGSGRVTIDGGAGVAGAREIVTAFLQEQA
jgi:hypothetical protein